MTDDSNARYRQSDPFARTADHADAHANDPLAELARLIGQTDHIAQAPREEPQPPRAPQYYDDPQYQEEPEQHFEPELPQEPAYQEPAYQQPAYQQPAYQQPAYQEPAYQQPAYQQPAYQEPVYQEPVYEERAAYEPRLDAPQAHHAVEPTMPEEPQPAPSRWPPFDPFAPASSRAVDPDEEHIRRSLQQQPEFVFPPIDRGAPRPAQPSSFGSYDPPSLGLAERAPQSPLNMPPPMRPAPERAPSPLDMADPAPQSPPPLDEYYDDVPERGRRKGLLTVAAVFCLAVVGTASAFGYRTWFNAPSGKATTPALIRASAEPTKVAPPAPAVDPNASKISYDRFADRGQNEKVVLREEKPVDLRDATRNPGMNTSPVPMASQGNSSAFAPAAANPPSVLTDPKKVRTLTIRPDAPDTTAMTRPPMVQPPATAAAAPPPAPVRQAAAGPSNVPLDLSNPSSPPAQARAAVPRSTPPAAVRPAPPPPPANAPLSLAPDSAAQPTATPRSQPARVASAPAVASSGGGNGSYLVQVSSQRSEADAQAAFRTVKSKYGSVLGDRQPVIRRADLAGRGTYYRAMVGPFATRDQAVQLCSSLKAAGGDCVVQAN